jgi:hypothetical protein
MDCSWELLAMSLVEGLVRDFEDFKVWLRLRKSDKEYIVEILLGEKTEDF